MPKSLPPLSSVNRLTNGNIELTIKVPWVDIHQVYTQVVDEAVKNAEIKGFRKGHAPRLLVKAKLDRNQIFSSALQRLLPQVYQRAVDEHGLKPVVYPQIRIDQGKEGEDWVFTASLCEAPVVKSGQVKVPDLLVEVETNRRLAELAENLTRLGLTVDKYLSTKKLTLADLKAKFATEARQDLTKHAIMSS